jgi:GlpG protein
MRRIGILLDEAGARRFRNYLLTLGINSVVDRASDDPSWEIWILAEDDLQTARGEFLEFAAAPDQTKYDVAEQADQIRRQRIDRQWKPRTPGGGTVDAERPVPAEPIPAEPRPAKLAQDSRPPTDNGEPARALNPLLDSEVKQQGIPITIAIIILSVLASFATNFASPRGSRIPAQTTLEERLFDGLSFVDRQRYDVDQDSFAALRQGQLWRLITPLFLHGNMFHLFFNMFFIFLLGSMIERIHGSLFFLLLTLITQTVGMLVQVMLPDAAFMPESLRGSPFAIGASGAAYGFFGFMWIRPWLDADYPIELDSTQFMIIMGGLIVCLTPLVPNVANGAHLGGLAAGMAVAAIGYSLRR